MSIVMKTIAGVILILLSVPIGYLFRPKVKDDAKIWLLIYVDMIGVIIGIAALGTILIMY